jgi:hypothetical protein
MTVDWQDVTPAYNDQACMCGAHAQHRLYSFLFFNPSATLKDASEALHISYSNARLLSTRLRRRKDFGRLCPLCFAPRFYSGSCQNCGFMVDGQPHTTEADFDATSPVHRILPDRGLGGSVSVSNYASLARTLYSGEKLPPARLRKHARNLSHLAEPRQDSLLKAIDSDLLEVLKLRYPDDGVSDMAARLAADEVRRFRRNYPALTAPKGLRRQLVDNVLRRLELLYPQLTREAPDRNTATRVLRDMKE